MVEADKALAVIDRLREHLAKDRLEDAAGEAEWLWSIVGRIVDELGRPVVDRARVLELAQRAVAAREATYGAPSESFALIAELWSTCFGRRFEAWEVAIALDLMKTARIMASPRHADSWVDKAGYAACGGEVSADRKGSP